MCLSVSVRDKNKNKKAKIEKLAKLISPSPEPVTSHYQNTKLYKKNTGY